MQKPSVAQVSTVVKGRDKNVLERKPDIQIYRTTFSYSRDLYSSRLTMILRIYCPTVSGGQ